MRQAQQSNVTIGKLLLLAALAFGFYNADKLEKIFNNKPNVSVVANAVAAPSDATKALLSSELETIKSVAGKAKESGISNVLLGDHYRDMTKYVLANDKLVKTTGDLRKVQLELTNEFFNTFYPGRTKNPEFSNAANAVWAKSLGTTVTDVDVLPITPEMRTKLINGGNAIAWACYQGN